VVVVVVCCSGCRSCNCLFVCLMIAVWHMMNFPKGLINTCLFCFYMLCLRHSLALHAHSCAGSFLAHSHIYHHIHSSVSHPVSRLTSRPLTYLTVLPAEVGFAVANVAVDAIFTTAPVLTRRLWLALITVCRAHTHTHTHTHTHIRDTHTTVSNPCPHFPPPPPPRFKPQILTAKDYKPTKTIKF